MTDITTLRADLESLKSSLRSGAMRTRFADREVFYRSVNEMQAQISALETEIAATDGTAVVRSINVRSTGWT